MLIKTLVTLMLVVLPNSDPQIEVVTKSDQSYEVSGRLFLDHQFSGDATTAKTAASCINCKWHLQLICPDLLTDSADANFNCAEPISYSCNTANQQRYRVWFLGPGLWRPSDWEVTGTVCLGPSGPRQLTSIQTELVETATGELPALKIQLQPKSNSLVNLPTRAVVKSPNSFQFTTEISGVVVTVTATAIYRYSFGDGFTTSTPAKSISHIYRARGSRPVEVTATWHATWSSNLHGPNAVTGSAIVQTKSAMANVLAVRGRLVKR
jgi:hypothetical protein